MTVRELEIVLPTALLAGCYTSILAPKPVLGFLAGFGVTLVLGLWAYAGEKEQGRGVTPGPDDAQK